MAGAATGSGRRPARERAFVLLYQADQRDLDADEILADEILEPDPYTTALVEGVDGLRSTVDAVIAEFAQGWTIDRMPLVDLTVLRIAVFELSERPDIPTAVVLNEAVDLVNTYSTDDSGRFVNGLLASAAERLRPTS